jgi:hypothetical protein
MVSNACFSQNKKGAMHARRAGQLELCRSGIFL